MSVIKQYKYSIGFVLSIVIATILFFTGVFHTLVAQLDGFGYFSAFFAGILFPFTFTAAAAGLYLVEIGDTLHPVLLALLAGIGAMFADLLMFRFIKGSILTEINLFIKAMMPRPTLVHMEQITKRRIWRWAIPFLASLMIASPLPDEIGVALFGIINFRPKYLVIITYVLNTIGIFALVFLGNALSS